MPDEPTPAPETQETPPQEAPDAEVQQTETPEDVNWQERYENLHPEFTRKSQELADYERLFEALQDPEQAPELLEQLGYQPVDDNEEFDEEGYDPYEELRGEVEALKEARTAEEQEAAQEDFLEAEFAYIDDQLAGLEQEAGRKLGEDEATTVGQLAQQMRNEQGIPDVKGAFQRLDGLSKARQSEYVQGKREALPAPYGQPGSEKVNLRDDQARRRALANTIEAEADEAG